MDKARATQAIATTLISHTGTRVRVLHLVSSIVENMSTRVSQRSDTRIPLSDYTNARKVYPASSESVISFPGSIYNALPGSGSEEVPAFETGGHQRSRSLEQLPPVHSIHHPTALDTITEKTSLNTLQLAAMKGKSFSLDDLSRFTRKAKFWKSGSSLVGSPRRLSIEYPKQPHLLPPSRMPTPPRIPSFNTPAACAYRLPPPETGSRDRLQMTISQAEREYLRQTRDLPRGTMMRGSDGTLVRGWWRPSQSGHTGYPRGGEQTPLRTMLNPITTSKSQRPSATQAIAPRKGGWIKFLEQICCCYDDDQEAEQIPPTRAFHPYVI